MLRQLLDSYSTAELKICRICLRTECRAFKYDRFQLKQYYEEIMALPVYEKDELPKFFCYECSTLLHKFHKFKEKCMMGQKTLREINQREAITYEAIDNIDRCKKFLNSPLDILKVNDRVKTEILDTESDSEDEDDIDTKEIEFVSDKDTNKKIDLDDDFIMDDGDNHFNDTTEPMADDESSDNKPIIELRTDHFINDELQIEVDDYKSDDNDTVFVDVKKQTTLPRKKVKLQRKTNIIEFIGKNGKSTSGLRFTKRKKLAVNPNCWQKTVLTEEEAIRDFRKKADDPKYIASNFKCTDCLKHFLKEERLNRHIKLRHHESNGSMQCRFCRIRYRIDCKLRLHMRQHFTRYKCNSCSLVCCSETSALAHEQTHSGILIKCQHCSDEFRHMSSYYTHLRTHRSAHVCVTCGESFVSATGLRQHTHIKHKHNKDIDRDSLEDDESANTFCKKCDITFLSRKAFEEHLFQSANHVDEAMGDEIPNRKVLANRVKAKITGDLKEKRSDENDMLPMPRKRHRRIKRPQRKPTTCHQCGIHFNTQAACMKHHLEAHPRTSFCPPSDRHICEICGVSLAPGSIAMHHNIHTREREYPCETCGKAFHSSIGLKRHLVTHTGEKPFGCPLCDKKFTQSNSMKLHYRTFHLKQPYPKRNRRKNKDEPSTALDDDKSSESDSHSDSRVHQNQHLQYLTLG